MLSFPPASPFTTPMHQFGIKEGKIYEIKARSGERSIMRSRDSAEEREGGARMVSGSCNTSRSSLMELKRSNNVEGLRERESDGSGIGGNRTHTLSLSLISQCVRDVACTWFIREHHAPHSVGAFLLSHAFFRTVLLYTCSLIHHPNE